MTITPERLAEIIQECTLDAVIKEIPFSDNRFLIAIATALLSQLEIREKGENQIQTVYDKYKHLWEINN